MSLNPLDGSWVVEHYFDSDGVELRYFKDRALAEKWVQLHPRDVLHAPEGLE